MHESKDQIAYRAGEKPRARFRSADRCFQMNGQWYFATREGINVGPYKTREATDLAATKLASLLRRVTDPIVTRRLIEGFMPQADPWSGRSPR